MSATDFADVHGVSSTLAADPPRTSAPIAMSDVHAWPKIAKSKPTFHPLKLVRRLVNGESDFALRLSSWGIQPGVEAATRKLCHVQVL
jgi:hypothetical protein